MPSVVQTKVSDQFFVQKCPKHDLKINIFEKFKKVSQIFSRAISVPNFRHIRPFMASLECPKGFGRFRFQDQVPRSKNWKISKIEKRFPGIHQSFKCAEFQTDLIIYAFNRMP